MERRDYVSRVQPERARGELKQKFKKSAIQINMVSGCGAVGSALPWGGRGRKFKSCHSDQEKHRKQPFSMLFSFVFSGFSYFFGQTASPIKPLTTIATTIDFLRLNKGERKFN